MNSESEIRGIEECYFFKKTFLIFFSKLLVYTNSNNFLWNKQIHTSSLFFQLKTGYSNRLRHCSRPLIKGGVCFLSLKGLAFFLIYGD